MSSTAPSPAETADAFFSAYHALRHHIDRRVDAAMGEGAIPMACSKLLGVLDDQGPKRFTELARITGTGARSVTQTVDILERDGLAERRPDPADRRATLVGITDLGSDTYRRSVGPKLDAFDDVFGALTDRQRTAFVAALRTLRARV
jgi:DNA-binding MarR family transcriptional regulator